MNMLAGYVMLLWCSVGRAFGGDEGVTDALYRMAREMMAGNEPAGAVALLEAACREAVRFGEEITNGYQRGFFYWLQLAEAYRYAQPGDFGPVAYQACVRATAYMPAQSVLWASAASARVPAAHLYQQMGHACNNIGRISDAAACFTTSLAMGSNDWNVWQDCAGMLAMLAVDEGDMARAQRLLADLFASTNEPSMYSYSSYARVLFHARKYREMFQVLLEYFAVQQLDREQPWKNPVLMCALQHVGVATDEEIRALYDALGHQLELAPFYAGTEEGVVFLINQRTSLRHCFAFLPREDDVERLQQRVRITQRPSGGTP